MTSSQLDDEVASDAQLITAARGGDLDAFEVLYRRHVAAARNRARQVAQSPAEVDDLVSEAFAKVLEALQAGRGPDTAFRAYLLTTLRNVRYDRHRRDRRVEYSGDLSDVDPGVPFVDPVLAQLEASLIAKAFTSLPERWQTVLWHTEVEGETPAQIAPLLGLTPNGVSALAYRAREGLRQAYLQMHLADLKTDARAGTKADPRAAAKPGAKAAKATKADPAAERCRGTMERLGAWTRLGLSKRERGQVDSHLAGCASCTTLASELVDVNSGLRAVMVPLVIGAPLLAGKLTAEVATGVGIAGAAAGASAGAGGVAGGAAGAAAAGTAAAKVGLAALLQLPGALKIAAGVTAAAVVSGVATMALSSPPSTPAAPTGVGQLSPAQGAPRTTSAHPRVSPPSSPIGAGRRGGTDPGGGRPGPVSSVPGAGIPASAPPVLPDPGATFPGMGGTEPDPGSHMTLRSAGAQPDGTLTQGKNGKITVNIQNGATSTATNVRADVTLPAGVQLRAGKDAADPATLAVPKKNWACEATASGATCLLGQLPAGRTTTLMLKVRLASTAESGALSGTLSADAGIVGQIPATEIPVTDPPAKKGE
jgi:RNA polymerase sigma factor (sigma-70 family)